MLYVVAAFPVLYIAITLMLVVRRTLKIIDLYEEHTFVRSREQKTHIRQHATLLRNSYKNDLIWLKDALVKLKKAFEWLKTV